METYKNPCWGAKITTNRYVMKTVFKIDAGVLSYEQNPLTSPGSRPIRRGPNIDSVQIQPVG